MQHYTEKVVENIFQRGDIQPLPTTNLDVDFLGVDVTNGFISHYMYDDEMVRYVNDTGSIRGFNGGVLSHSLFWDIDNADLNVSFAETRELIDRLYSMNGSYEGIFVFFSGNKGFHVYIHSSDMEALGKSDKIPAVTKFVCASFSSGLPSVDESVYDRTRIIRAPNTIHPKSGLYKHLFDTDTFLSMTCEDILETAKAQSNIHMSYTPVSSEFLRNIITTSIKNPDVGTERKNTRMDILEGIYTGFSSGNGNVGLTSVAGLLHSRNISTDMIRAIIHAINSNWEQPMSDGALDTIVDSVSRYAVEDDYVPTTSDAIMTMSDAADKWLALKQKQTYIETGFGLMDVHLTNFDPGKVLMIAARGGVGKTLLGMQIGNEIARNLGGYTLFVSIEMAASAIYYRSAQIQDNEDGVFMESRQFSEKLLVDKELRSRTLKSWESTLVVDDSTVGMDKIESYYNHAQEKYDNKMRAILIDYVGLLSGTDDYKGMSKVAKTLKSLSKKLNVRIILLVQLSRKGGDGKIPVTLDMLRDAGTLEEAADMVLGMWLSPANDRRVHCRFIKNRDGERNGQFDLIQSGLSYESEEFDDSDDTIRDGGDGGRW